MELNEDTNFKSLGIYLKNKRVVLGLTQSDVAAKLGYGSPQFISNIERGISSVPLKSLKVLIDLYKIPPTEVLDILLEEKRKQLSKVLGITSTTTEMNEITQ